MDNYQEAVLRAIMELMGQTITARLQEELLGFRAHMVKCLEDLVSMEDRARIRADL